jgi:hypothetical protein
MRSTGMQIGGGAALEPPVPHPRTVAGARTDLRPVKQHARSPAQIEPWPFFVRRRKTREKVGAKIKVDAQREPRPPKERSRRDLRRPGRR